MIEDSPQPSRRQLPNRRLSEIHEIEVSGQVYSIGVGFFDDGAVGELFISGPKVGSEMDAVLADGAILASLALQHGTPAAALSKSMSRQSTGPWEAATLPASPLGAAMDLVARLAKAEGPDAA